MLGVHEAGTKPHGCGGEAEAEDFEAHFDVDRHRVFLSGYASGGSLAYRTAFRHSSTFAGLIAENTAPFRDTESTQAESVAAATTKFHIVHVAQSEDQVYPLAEELLVPYIERKGWTSP